MSDEKLAILGGKPVFEGVFKEKWKRPKEQEKALLSTMIDHNDFSGAGVGMGKAFEDAFASYIGCKYCLAFSHGTDALMAAYYAAGVGPGDEVITPATGFIGSYAGALHLGARPVFCDVEPYSILIDPACIRKAITPRTKAINIVHLWGMVCDLDALMAISREHGIPLIDDASHAHGGEWGGTKLGNFDHVTCFSLQGVNPGGKGVAAGEGGVACTNNRAYYQRMLAYCHLHREHLLEDLQGSPYQEMDREVLGLKSRAHPLALGIGMISLSTLNLRNAKRTENREKTVEALTEFDFISIPKGAEKGKMAGFFGGLKFLYEPSRLSNLSSQTFIKCLHAEGVPVKGPWSGFLEYRHNIFRKGFDLWGHDRGPIGKPWAGLDNFAGYSETDFPISESLSQKVFTLPSFVDVDTEYYLRLVQALRKIRKDHQLVLP
ncbi:MAG: DegT/DnrJ/EryC1/StrS family aminotransferase [Parachlamydia sp.]|nr:DegT/DnrJ/EryC1/StrS family aminotransferase [Parachlamydia sp.]